MERDVTVRYLVAEPIKEPKIRKNMPASDLSIGDSCCLPLVRIVAMRQIGPTSVLLKWSTICDLKVDGYEIWVDDVLNAKVFSGSRMCTVIDALKPDTVHKVSVFAISNETGSYNPPVVGTITMVPYGVSNKLLSQFKEIVGVDVIN